MAARQDWPYQKKICCRTWKEEKAVNKKELHHGRKQTIHFLKAGSLMERQQVLLLQLFLTIVTSAVVIMTNNAAFRDPVTLTGWPIKNTEVMKITAVAGISAQG